MLIKPGREISPIKSDYTNETFLLTSSLPSEFTCTRNDTAATYRDSNGVMQVAAANTARFDHDTSGNALGLLVEGSRQNKVTTYNASPVNTTGFAFLGDVNGVLSVVDDTAALAAAGLGSVGNGKVFKLDNTAGSGFTYADVPGTTGNTNNHSVSVYARGVGAGSRTGTLFIGDATLNIAPHNGGYVRYKLEDQTIDGTSRKIRIGAEAGETVYFILPQLEEAAFISTPIITAGSAATRQQDVITADLTGVPWFNENHGYLGARYRPQKAVIGADQYILTAHDDSADNTAGIRIDDSASGTLQGWIRDDSASLHAKSDDLVHISGALAASGITWNNEEAIMLHSGVNTTRTYSGIPSGIVTLQIGARNGSNDPFWGHVESIYVGANKVSARTLGSKIYASTDIAGIGGGQSLMTGHFDSQEDNTDPGRAQFNTTGTGFNDDKVIAWVNGATGSSAAAKTSDATNYWWDNDTDTAGPAFTSFVEAVNDSGITPRFVTWSQGEHDSYDIGVGNTTRAQYKTALVSIFTEMRDLYGDIPVFIQKLGRRSASEPSNAGAQAVREVQAEIIAENSWAYLGAESFDTALNDETGVSDTVHLANSGYTTVAQRLARKIYDYFGETVTGGIDGATITNAVRTTTSVAVTIAHDSGTDFTPTSGIEGFHFFDDSTEITITGAVRTNATTITLTLDSEPSGVETLYYIYNVEIDNSDPANFVKDNATVSMPLQPTKITL